MTHMTTSLRPVAGLPLAAGLLAMAACSDTALTGPIDDTELQDSAVVVFTALGLAREHNDILFVTDDGWYRILASASDEIVHDGSSTDETRWTLGDFRDRGNSGRYEQINEAMWASYKVVDLAKGLFPPERFQESPVVARAWLSAGWSERLLSDFYCEATFQYGPFGGFNLVNLGDVEYDRGVIAGQDSILKRVAFAMEQAIIHADNAIAAGIGPRAEDPEYFDPELIRLSAYAGLAQARIALASIGVDPAQNYTAAREAAAEVPTSHEEDVETNAQLRDNENYDISWLNDDFTTWGMRIGDQAWGSAAAYLRDGPNDPRASFTVCGDYEVDDGTFEEILASPVVEGPDFLTCESAGGSDLVTERGYARWLPNRDTWSEFGSFMLVRGTEMRLIEAEAALADGDLAAFTDAVNAARAEWGLDPIEPPASVGEMEYPNAEDDAWSILDREYLLDGFLDGRRMFHLNRWSHPFVTENRVYLPEHLDEPIDRMACHPLPENECSLNPDIECPVLTGS